MLMSAFIVLLMILYTLIAAFALFMTHQEQRQTQNTNLFWNSLSLLACLFWPATVMMVAVAVSLQRKGPGSHSAPRVTPQIAHATSK